MINSRHTKAMMAETAILESSHLPVQIWVQGDPFSCVLATINCSFSSTGSKMLPVENCKIGDPFQSIVGKQEF